jgi:hypothetical protein
LAVGLLAVSLVFAEDKCTVSGDVVYSKEADIFVCLHNKQTFHEWKILPPGSFTQKIKANPSGEASFTFKDVLKGDYLIIAPMKGRPFTFHNDTPALNRSAYSLIPCPSLSMTA